MLRISKYAWIKLGLLNLSLVALVGMLMRYKIIYALPWLNQSYLLHAHSHFAFTGWIGHTLLVLITSWLAGVLGLEFKKMRVYQLLILCNLICAYGILVSFTLAGYNFVSDALSFGTMVISTIFAIRFFRDTAKVQHPSLKWFKAAFWFYIISGLGTISLAYMMASGNISQKLYLTSVYFYLHFQYNGWFIFSCIGLLLAWVHQREPIPSTMKDGFRYFVYACPPAFLLSTLWLKLPVWLIILVAIAAIFQIVGFFHLVKRLYLSPGLKSNHLQGIIRVLLIFSGLALGVKLFLQVGSTVPKVSELVFGFRHIVIAYLHLVLLCIVSLFLLVYFRMENIFTKSRTNVIALVVFTFFVYLNEITLAVQGIASFSYISIPGGNQILFYAASGLFIGALFLLLSARRNTSKELSEL